MVTIESTFGVDDQTAGSGFVVERAARADRDGLARRHAGAKAGSPTATRRRAVYIVLDDGTRADAHVLGYDLFEDTALLQVDPEHLGLRALPLGRARSLRVGDPVAVIGSPFENRASLSTGVVSQLDRQIAAPGRLLPDDRRRSRRTPPSTRATPAARCWTRDGAVVGMVTAINPDARGGVAYAVPMEAVREAYQALAARAARRLRLAGRRGGDADAAARGLRSASGSSTARSCRASAPGGAAERAGLQAGTQPGRGRRAGVSARRRRDRRGRDDAGRGLPRPRSRDRRATVPARRVDLHVVRRGSSRVVHVRLLPRPASFAGCG